MPSLFDDEDSWSLFVMLFQLGMISMGTEEACLLEGDSGDATAFYGLGDVVLKDSGDLRHIVSEGTVEVHCVLPEGLQITARKIALYCAQPHAVRLIAFEVVAWDVCVGSAVFELSPSLLLIGDQPLEAEQRSSFGRVVRLPGPRRELPARKVLTTAEGEISLWHLAAMGILDQCSLKRFLDSAATVSDGTLFEDLNECVGRPDDMHCYGADKLGIPGLDRKELTALAAYRTPVEICGLLRQPFLSGYDYDPRRLPRIIRFFIEQSLMECAKYGGFRRTVDYK
ncbi:MAG: hypothetical protein JJU20_15130 [Opitutales bacterium]|nr:hypothetical protein [Opitutales bacterium]